MFNIYRQMIHYLCLYIIIAHRLWLQQLAETCSSVITKFCAVAENETSVLLKITIFYIKRLITLCYNCKLLYELLFTFLCFQIS